MQPTDVHKATDKGFVPVLIIARYLRRAREVLLPKGRKLESDSANSSVKSLYLARLNRKVLDKVVGERWIDRFTLKEVFKIGLIRKPVSLIRPVVQAFDQ